MTEPKRSSKLLIYESRRYLYCVYRAPGDWSSPNTISLIGTDGDALAGVLQQVRKKVGLATDAADWSAAGTVENPANNEINATGPSAGRSTASFSCRRLMADSFASSRRR
jgi:hypothetical protein